MLPLTESEMNINATRAREQMTKDVAKELVDIHMRHAGSDEHAWALAAGMFAVVVEKATKDEILLLSMEFVRIAIELMDRKD